MATELAPRATEEVTSRPNLTVQNGGMNQMLARIGGSKAVAPLLVIGVAVTAMVMLSQWAMKPPYVTVLNGVGMDRIGAAQQRLHGVGIPFELGPGGLSLTVPQDKLAAARVALAQEGLVDGSAPGFELFDQPAWGMTDFTQQINYRRALEGELERAIGGMRGIQSADVGLALQQSSFLQAGGPQNSASVLLGLNAPGAADESLVRSIQAWVAGSVDGIGVDDVTVVDSNGMVLSGAGVGTDGLSAPQLEAREDIESFLESKAMGILTPIVGSGNATVRVSADLDFERIDKTTQRLVPDDQVTIREDRMEVTPETPEQGAAQVTSNVINETTRENSVSSLTGPRVTRLSVAVVVNDVENTAPDGSVSYTARTGPELAEFQALVRNAVGLNPGRGDQISIASMPFQRPTLVAADPSVDEGLDYVQLASQAQRPLLAVFGLGMAAFVGLRAVKALPKPSPTPAMVAAAPQPRLELVHEPPRMSAPAPAEPPPPPPPVVNDPAVAAKVVRAWMRD